MISGAAVAAGSVAAGSAAMELNTARAAGTVAEISTAAGRGLTNILASSSGAATDGETIQLLERTNEPKPPMNPNEQELIHSETQLHSELSMHRWGTPISESSVKTLAEKIFSKIPPRLRGEYSTELLKRMLTGRSGRDTGPVGGDPVSRPPHIRAPGPGPVSAGGCGGGDGLAG